MSDANAGAEMQRFWTAVASGTRIGIVLPTLSPGICEECGKEVPVRWPWKKSRNSLPRFLCGLCRWVAGGSTCRVSREVKK